VSLNSVSYVPRIVMAKSEIRHLIGSTICGVVALALLATCFGTEFWVTAKVITKGSVSDADVSTLHHGLFTGSMDRAVLGTKQTFSLYGKIHFPISFINELKAV